MFHGIIVNCKDSCCSAEATTKLAAGCITPVRITLNAAFDSLPVRYLVTQCADHTERFDISMSLELELPGSCFIPGESSLSAYGLPTRTGQK